MVDRTVKYDPKQSFEVRSYDVEYRSAYGRSWEARIYQPQGEGPFPAVLDVHGGAWSGGSRLNAELINRGLAASGLMIAAVDFRVGPEHTYPAQTADVNYATRWLKAHAGDFNADASVIGGHGSSSGGHTIMLSAMRPSDERYAELTSPDVEGYDATVSYLLLSWPVLDSYARYMYAKEAGLDGLVSKTLGYFLTEDAIQEGSPQLVLERGEKAVLPPTLIVQGTADLNVPMSIPHRFVDSYRQAGGEIELEEFPDMPHGFGGEASKDTERAIKLMKLFAGRQLAAHVAAI